MNYIDKRDIIVGHSPDPDDAFMFYALTNNKIDTGKFNFIHYIHDIEHLNKKVLESSIDITAASLYTYLRVSDKYNLLSCGASVGDKYGPVLVSKNPDILKKNKKLRVAVPGKNTTACLLFNILCDFEYTQIYMQFDKVIDSIEKNEVDCGILIHEAQLFYNNIGLHKIIDFGELWFNKYKLPLPLGVNLVNKNICQEDTDFINSLIKKSISYSLENIDEALNYAMKYSSNPDKNLVKKFVSMYVNDVTLKFSKECKKSANILSKLAFDKNLIKKIVNI